MHLAKVTLFSLFFLLASSALAADVPIAVDSPKLADIAKERVIQQLRLQNAQLQFENAQFRLKELEEQEKKIRAEQETEKK